MTENTIRFFGRRKGKAITGIREQMLNEWLPKLTPTLPQRGKIKLKFGIKPKSLCLEVGFGGGEHLAEMAKRNPDTGYLGAEVFLNGVASLLAHLNGSHRSGTGEMALEDGRVDNIRIWPEDIRLLFEKLPDGIFDEIYVLYPDPWPKKRHAQRRFINDENIPVLWRLLAPKGKVYLATDVDNYAQWAMERMGESGIFTQTKRDIHTPPKGWITTRYEQKGIKAGRTPNYMIFQKKDKKVKKNLTNAKK